MFKKIIINIAFFLVGSIVTFCLIKTFDVFLWFRPSFRENSMRLTAKGGPFKIYSSPRTGQRDFIVFRGNEILVKSESMSGSSDNYNIIYCENGSPVI